MTPSPLSFAAFVLFGVCFWPIGTSAAFGFGWPIARFVGWRQFDRGSNICSRPGCHRVLLITPQSQFHSSPSAGASPLALKAWPWEENEELAAEREETTSALKKAEAEALQYEKRAARLESALKNRTAELKLMKNRVVILQDVARKLKQGQNKTLVELEAVKARADERDGLEATLNATYDELDRQTSKLQRLLDDEKRVRKEVVLQYDDLMNELERKDMELRNVQEKTKRDLSEIERRLKAERRGRAKDRDEFDRVTADLGSRLESATSVVKEMEVELNRTVADIQALQREGRKDDDEVKTIAKEERKKRQFLKQELVAARMAEREAAEELERMQERYAKQKKSHAVKEREWKRNVTIASGDRIDKDKTKPKPPQKSLESEKALERAKERVEIATASVRAAEMREEKARKRLEKVQDDLRSVQQDNDRLSVELSDALDRQNTATDRLEIFRSSHGRREEALAKRVARAEQNLRRVEEEMDLLRSERDGVRDALLSERLKFAGERREEQMRYDRIMRDERDGYETEISLLKDQLSRQAARKASVVGDSGPSIARQDANGEDRQLSISMVAAADVEESPTEQSRKKKRKGRLGRAWRRITSPRSWWFVG